MTTSPGYSRVVLPVAVIEQRRRMGLDRRDEVWDGELHMAPPPSICHQDLAGNLYVALRRFAARRGLAVLYEVGVRDPTRGWDDFRVPDLVVFDPSQASNAAIEGRAEIVVEVLSPDDESRYKLDFYARRGVREVWIADPVARTIEVFVLRGDAYEPSPSGAAPALELEILHEPLHIRGGDETFDL